MLKSKQNISDEMSKKIISTVRDLAISKGANSISVRDVLKELEISNRVFYNRFNNIDEVLALIYEEISNSFHKEVYLDYSNADEFIDNIITFMETTLIESYKRKGNLNQFIFEQDSISDNNFHWWNNEIKRIINYAIEKGFIRNIETDQLSYAIWCFIRGFNTDALSRDIPLEKSLESFSYSFRLFLNGLKPNNE